MSLPWVNTWRSPSRRSFVVAPHAPKERECCRSMPIGSSVDASPTNTDNEFGLLPELELPAPVVLLVAPASASLASPVTAENPAAETLSSTTGVLAAATRHPRWCKPPELRAPVHPPQGGRRWESLEELDGKAQRWVR